MIVFLLCQCKIAISFVNKIRHHDARPFRFWFNNMGVFSAPEDRSIIITLKCSFTDCQGHSRSLRRASLASFVGAFVKLRNPCETILRRNFFLYSTTSGHSCMTFLLLSAPEIPSHPSIFVQFRHHFFVEILALMFRLGVKNCSPTDRKSQW